MQTHEPFPSFLTSVVTRAARIGRCAPALLCAVLLLCVALPRPAAAQNLTYDSTRRLYFDPG